MWQALGTPLAIRCTSWFATSCEKQCIPQSMQKYDSTVIRTVNYWPALVLNKDDPFPHTTQLIHWWTWNIFRWDRTNEDNSCLINTVVAILYVLTMLYFSLHQDHAYKDLWTNYMDFPLFLALMSIYVRPNHDLWLQQEKLNQEIFHQCKDQIEIIHEYKYLGVDFHSHGHFISSSKRQLRVLKPWWASQGNKL